MWTGRLNGGGPSGIVAGGGGVGCGGSGEICGLWEWVEGLERWRRVRRVVGMVG